MKISENQRKVLQDLYDYRDDMCVRFFCHIADSTGLTIRAVRLACRALTRKGLAYYERGLENEDGELLGSAYFCSEDGEKFIEGKEVAESDFGYTFSSKF